MDKRHWLLLGYLIIPVCFFVAVIAVGLLRSHSLIEIYNDELGILRHCITFCLVCLYIFAGSIFLINKEFRRLSNEYYLYSVGGYSWYSFGSHR